MNHIAQKALGSVSESTRKLNPKLFPFTGSVKADTLPSTADACRHEISDLHEPIIAWCNSHVPAVPYIHSRTDKRSTTAKGVPDFVLVYKGQVLFIECKTKTGKLTSEQQAFKLLVERQGFVVHVIRSMAEFYMIITDVNTSL